MFFVYIGIAKIHHPKRGHWVSIKHTGIQERLKEGIDADEHDATMLENAYGD